jgi:hypothetical protein
MVDEKITSIIVESSIEIPCEYNQLKKCYLLHPLSLEAKQFIDKNDTFFLESIQLADSYKFSCKAIINEQVYTLEGCFIIIQLSGKIEFYHDHKILNLKDK